MKNNILYGAILGDLCGQPFEFAKKTGYNKPIVLHNPDSKFTDDTVMTLATAYALMNNVTFEYAYKTFGKKYPKAGYGPKFREWINTPFGTINDSWGNGALMRVSPIMYLENKLAIDLATASCYNSHWHDVSLHSVFALAALYVYRPECSGSQEIEKFSKFEVGCKETLKFVENIFSNNLSTRCSILKAVECGGDTDTNASIIGELCNYHNQDLTQEDVDYVESKLDVFLLNVLKDFNRWIKSK